MKYSISFLEEHINADQVSRKRDGTGNVIFRKEYFYHGNNNNEKFANSISNQLTELDINHTIVDHGDHWAQFSGGASVAKSSHFWVIIKFD